MSRAYLSLGANLGDRLGQLAEALRLLDRLPGARLAAVSGVYETAPQGKTDQPDFLNCAALLETELSPLALLEGIHGVERAMGRERRERWGPRTIDIDILLFGDQVISRPELEIPHPRMADRAFVLIPLLEVAPEREEVRRWLSALPDQGVRLHLDGSSFHRLIQGVE
ncbi:MAG: 2-amino-4-hydroxy-6-hydroxymethyldihydropteridine diphosphokinase [Bacillota bacterium]